MCLHLTTYHFESLFTPRPRESEWEKKRKDKKDGVCGGFRWKESEANGKCTQPRGSTSCQGVFETTLD